MAGDPARLATSGEIWDSGELEAAATEAVYAGRPLRMNQACHWSVRVRDEAGGWSEWSAPAGWVMGPLDTRDSGIGMHGDWIDWVNAGFKKIKTGGSI